MNQFIVDDTIFTPEERDQLLKIIAIAQKRARQKEMDKEFEHFYSALMAHMADRNITIGILDDRKEHPAAPTSCIYEFSRILRSHYFGIKK